MRPHSGPATLVIFLIMAAILIAAEFIVNLLFPEISLPFAQKTLFNALLLCLIALPLFYVLLAFKNKNQDEKTRTFYNILESSSEAILITDEKANIEYINPAFSRITGYTQKDVKGKNPRIMKSGRHNAEFYEKMWQSIKKSGRWEGEVWDRRKDGEIYPKWLTISAVKNKKGKDLKYIGTFSDITALKQTEEHLEHATNYDPVTGLPNRILFRDRLRQAIFLAQRFNTLAAIIFLDINRFRNINDTFGHTTGDLLLKEIGVRLSGCIRKNDTVAYLGGDEFSVILSGIDTEKTAALIAEEIRESISKQFTLKGYNVFVTINMGITVCPMDGDDINILYRNADMALNAAKKEGENKFKFYDLKMSEKLSGYLSMETNLRYALEREEFVLHYQAQADLKTGEIIGMEALIRRQEANWLVPPGMFIHIAEEVGLIIPICEWTLRKACRQAKLWQEEGLAPLRISVNVSAYQFDQRRLISSVKEVLEETKLDPKYLELELTERIIMRDVSEAIAIMSELKKMGVALSIDDFGTGYSSLSYLKKFPIDKLKIDISFVKDLPDDPDSASIAKAIIALAHSLQLKVIAEGVENEKQLSFLREHGCDEMQGFYFSIPLAAQSFKKIIQRGKKLGTA